MKALLTIGSLPKTVPVVDLCFYAELLRSSGPIQLYRISDVALYEGETNVS